MRTHAILQGRCHANTLETERRLLAPKDGVPLSSANIFHPFSSIIQWGRRDEEEFTDTVDAAADEPRKGGPANDENKNGGVFGGRKQED